VVRGHSARAHPAKSLPEISDAILAVPQPARPRPHHILLDGLAVLAKEGFAAAAPTLRRGAKVIPEMSDEEVLRWGIAAAEATAAM
jgi:hypothetical protein